MGEIILFICYCSLALYATIYMISWFAVRQKERKERCRAMESGKEIDVLYGIIMDD